MHVCDLQQIFMTMFIGFSVNTSCTELIKSTDDIEPFIVALPMPSLTYHRSYMLWYALILLKKPYSECIELPFHRVLARVKSVCVCLV